MNWKTKSLIQRACSALPVGSEAIYYFLQRNFGTFSAPPDPIPNIRHMVDMVKDLAETGFSVEGKRVMEVGTGRRLDMPLAFHLLGAASVDTFDLHRYMRPELVERALEVVLKNQDQVMAMYSPFTDEAALAGRLKKLSAVRSAAEMLAVAGIRYHAPADAARTSLPDGSIDLHFSYTVFEHIPKPVLVAILREASRVLGKTGLACHHIDPSDHFAHDDQSISAINFLQYEESEWARYNDNQFAYQNRLRSNDYEKIYREAGHEVLLWRTYQDARGLKELTAGTLPLATPFRGVPPEILACTAVRAVSRAAAQAKPRVTDSPVDDRI